MIYSIDSGQEPSDFDVVVKWKRMSIQVVSMFVIFFFKTFSHVLRIILGVLEKLSLLNNACKWFLCRHIVFYCALLYRYHVFHKLKGCDNPVLSKSTGTIFSTGLDDSIFQQ